MNVAQLRRALLDFDPEVEVRLMTQETWPFEHDILGLWHAVQGPDNCRECGAPESEHPFMVDNPFVKGLGHEFVPYNSFEPHAAYEVLYLVEGSQLGYGTSTAWEEVMPT